MARVGKRGQEDADGGLPRATIRRAQKALEPSNQGGHERRMGVVGLERPKTPKMLNKKG
jgi:hypothetical protein